MSDRPHTSCSTFGTADFIRVPCPAARTTTDHPDCSMARIIAAPRASTDLERRADRDEGGGGARGAYRRRSSYSTCLATALSVSNTPIPWVATASKVGSPLKLRSRYMSSTGTAVGRSRLLNCST